MTVHRSRLRRRAGIVAGLLLVTVVVGCSAPSRDAGRSSGQPTTSDVRRHDVSGTSPGGTSPPPARSRAGLAARPDIERADPSYVALLDEVTGVLRRDGGLRATPSATKLTEMPCGPDPAHEPAVIRRHVRTFSGRAAASSWPVVLAAVDRIVRARRYTLRSDHERGPATWSTEWYDVDTVGSVSVHGGDRVVLSLYTACHRAPRPASTSPGAPR